MITTKKSEDERLKKYDLSSTLTFKRDTFYYTHHEDTNRIFSGTYSFNGTFLDTECEESGYNYKYDEIGAYQIIYLTGNEFLIVEQYLPRVRERRYVTVHDMVSTNRRILYQRQNMTQADKIPNYATAQRMLDEESHLDNINFVSSSIEGIWSLIYMDRKKYTHEVITENILDFKNGVFYENVCDYDTGQYSVDGMILSLFYKNGEEYYYKIINIFDNEHLVVEYIWNIKRYKKKNKTQKPLIRYMYKRIW
jgi:hypothetical protein